jgi:putative ABC transport system permease protein
MLLIVIAAVAIISPAFYFIDEWMQNFAYRAPLNFLLFAAVAVLALVFGFLTVAFHSLKTARTNPVHSLKYE